MGFLKNYYLKHMVQWFCDNCEAHLNRQENFSTKTGRWECTKCSYNNDVSAEYVAKGNKLKQTNEIKREKTECKFNGVISYDKFSFFAHSIEKHIKRLEIKVEGPFITGTVSTISGIDTWNFEVDFNDFGDITGNYWWVYCENDDSSIPEAFIKKMIMSITEENNKISKMNEDLLDTFNEEQKLMAKFLIYAKAKNITDPNVLEKYLNRENNFVVGKHITIQQIYDSLSKGQKKALDLYVGLALYNESDKMQENNFTIDEIMDTLNTEQKRMFDKIIETVVKYPEMEDFDEFFNRVSGYDIGEGRIIKEVYKTLNELQKQALNQYVEYVVEVDDDE